MALKVNKKEDSKAATTNLKGLEALRQQIKAVHGKEAINDPKAVFEIKRIPTGNLEIDLALDGGVPEGRIIEIYGPEASGKTTFTLALAAHAQKKGYGVGFVDMEHALDENYAATLGFNTRRDDVIISQPDNGEQALDIMKMMIESGDIKFIILDSIAALVPKAELEGETGKGAMGSQARMMSTALKQLCAKINKQKVTVVFTNQLRMKIGVMFGNPETTSGGNAMKFYASLRIDMRKSEQIKNGEEILGQCSNFKMIKNKTGRMIPTFPLRILYGVGFDNMQSVLNLAEAHGIVTKAGAWYSMEGKGNIAQGAEAMKELLKNDPKLTNEIVAKIKELRASGGVKLVASKKKDKKGKDKDKDKDKGKNEKVDDQVEAALGKDNQENSEEVA